MHSITRTTRTASPTTSASDSYRCPPGQTLRYMSMLRSPGGIPRRLYRASGTICRACPDFGVCTIEVITHDKLLRRGQRIIDLYND